MRYNSYRVKIAILNAGSSGSHPNNAPSPRITADWLALIDFARPWILYKNGLFHYIWGLLLTVLSVRFAHVVDPLFLLLCSSMEWMYHNLLIHSPVVDIWVISRFGYYDRSCYIFWWTQALSSFGCKLRETDIYFEVLQPFLEARVTVGSIIWVFDISREIQPCDLDRWEKEN